MHDHGCEIIIIPTPKKKKAPNNDLKITSQGI
jgi:hypothetical protein